MSPLRPIASWIVATPSPASRSMAARSARAMVRRTTPRGVLDMAILSPAPGAERLVEPGVDAAHVALVDLLAVGRGQRGRRVDVAPGVVEVVAGLGIDAAHRTDHLGREQDVVDRQDPDQEIDPGLVVGAGVEAPV